MCQSETGPALWWVAHPPEEVENTQSQRLINLDRNKGKKSAREYNIKII